MIQPQLLKKAIMFLARAQLQAYIVLLVPSLYNPNCRDSIRFHGPLTRFGVSSRPPCAEVPLTSTSGVSKYRVTLSFGSGAEFCKSHRFLLGCCRWVNGIHLNDIPLMGALASGVVVEGEGLPFQKARTFECEEVTLFLTAKTVFVFLLLVMIRHLHFVIGIILRYVNATD